MNELSLKATEFTPSIVFDEGKHFLEFVGVSRPENVTKFYEPVIEWMMDYEAELYKLHLENKKTFPLHFIFRFSYFNSATSKMIFSLLERAIRIKGMGFDLIIDWYYENGDDQMRDDGEELSEALDIPFNFFEH